MSSTHKEHVKQLKSQDPVQVVLTNMLDWLLKNIKLVILATVPVVVAVVGYFGWQAFTNYKRDGRVEELGKIQVVHENELRQANEQRQALLKKIEALDAKSKAEKSLDVAAAAKKPADAAGKAKNDDKLAADPKVEAEKAEIRKQIEAVKANHTESRQQFVAFSKKYENEAEGWMAGMTAAKLYIEDEKFSDAKPLLESVLEHSKKVTFYQIQSRLALMGISEDAGEFEKALEHASSLEKLVEKELLPQIMLAKGRILMLKNSKDDAKATFGKIIEDHGTTPEAQKARSLQALLN